MTTIQEFRMNPDSYLGFRELLQNQLMVDVLKILADAAPINLPIKNGITDVEASIVLGTASGYAIYANKLREMAEPWPMKQERPKETYGAPKQ